jgi:DNA-directed RNA polymerase subunit RPC12/RpoP
MKVYYCGKCGKVYVFKFQAPEKKSGIPYCCNRMLQKVAKKDVPSAITKT